MAELSWGSLGRTIMAGIMPSEIILQVNAQHADPDPPIRTFD